MELSKELIQTLLDYKEKPDDDNIRIKKIAREILIGDELIIYLLANKSLEDAEADVTDYIDDNILPNFLIEPVQTSAENFICLGTESTEQPEDNKYMKYQRVIFYILCDVKNNKEHYTGCARHDLIGARIKHLFNLTNVFGNKCMLVDERESVTDNDYATRTLVFEYTTDNNLAKTIKGKPTMNFRRFNAESS